MVRLESVMEGVSTSSNEPILNWPGIVNDAVAFYFAEPDAARAFVGRFCCAYRAQPRLGL